MMKIIAVFAFACVAVALATDAESDLQSPVESEIDQMNYRGFGRPRLPGRRPFSRPRYRALPEEQAEDENGVSSDMPESNNYNEIGVVPHWCICCCRNCCGKRRKRSIAFPAEEAADTLITVLGSETELKLYSSNDDLRTLYNTPVVRAQLVERALDPNVDRSIALVLGGKQSGVVVTLDDGRRFLVVKGNQLGQGRETVAIISNHMTDDWINVDTKIISRSTLGDFIKAGGYQFDVFKDNGRQAAQRMMALQ